VLRKESNSKAISFSEIHAPKKIKYKKKKGDVIICLYLEKKQLEMV